MEGVEVSTPTKSSWSPSPSASRPSLGRPSPSFRLRSPSLNTLRLRRIFDLFDHNGDGEITLDELSLALIRLGLGVDPDDLASIIASHIRPGRSGLEFADFDGLHRELGDSLAAEVDNVGDVVAAEESDMEEAFRVFDEDGDGYISALELQVVLSKLGLPEATSLSRVNQMICSVDRNRDGRVDFVEFKHMMLGISVRSS